MIYTMQSDVIFRIEETVRSRWSLDVDATDDDIADVHTNEYLVSTRIIRDWMIKCPNEYRYIARIIDAALNGSTGFEASSKYSFYDCPDWYDELYPDRDCADPIISFHYTVYK